MEMTYNLQEFNNKHVIFVGQDREWKSFERFINTHASPASVESVFITDENRAEMDTKLKAIDPEQTIVVKTAGYPGRLMPVPYTTPTKLFFQCALELKSYTIGVTGTKGKTTTASLIAHILKTADMPVVLAGNMGVPMLDALSKATSETVFVLELSSYQLSELETSPRMAVVTNLYRDHIDYHGDLEAYWEAKHNIVRYMDKSGSVVFNPDTEVVYHWLASSEAKQLPIDTMETVDMSKTQLIGDHNKLNYLLASKVAEQFNIDKLTCKSALDSFQAIPHRLQTVKIVNGITYIDDAIASAPEATVAGITACLHNVGPIGCVMLGGQDRDYDFSELVKLISTMNIPKLVLFPETSEKIKALFQEEYTPETFETSDMVEAVKWANDTCPSGSVCLLSTAAPSYSLWKDFEEKGNQFHYAVNDL